MEMSVKNSLQEAKIEMLKTYALSRLETEEPVIFQNELSSTELDKSEKMRWGRVCLRRLEDDKSCKTHDPMISTSKPNVVKTSKKAYGKDLSTVIFDPNVNSDSTKVKIAQNPHSKCPHSMTYNEKNQTLFQNLYSK